jgi:hypothetical protein
VGFELVAELQAAQRFHALQTPHLPPRRGLLEAAADRVWTADIRYNPTREEWLYLAAVEDLNSRRIVG